ncbi:hypothetical protein CDAR_562321 [Caerostris darwini]|uniref:Uncharacterized protein n=1 Tax=Caerostris darwini TaxID=1538125 RepID=A0AAV4X9F3_9ARAC|nr:hypothetical protein CDAR_562321 [Caerostris darwini]
MNALALQLGLPFVTGMRLEESISLRVGRYDSITALGETPRGGKASRERMQHEKNEIAHQNRRKNISHCNESSIFHRKLFVVKERISTGLGRDMNPETPRIEKRVSYSCTTHAQLLIKMLT